jgi:hypothetical protein
MYFIISTSEDGDVSMDSVDKEELLKRITPDEHGETYYGHREIRDTLPMFRDLQAKAGIYIIKGDLVIPRPAEVVKTFEVD